MLNTLTITLIQTAEVCLHAPTGYKYKNGETFSYNCNSDCTCNFPKASENKEKWLKQFWGIEAETWFGKNWAWDPDADWVIVCKPNALCLIDARKLDDLKVGFAKNGSWEVLVKGPRQTWQPSNFSTFWGHSLQEGVETRLGNQDISLYRKELAINKWSYENPTEREFDARKVGFSLAYLVSRGGGG